MRTYLNKTRNFFNNLSVKSPPSGSDGKLIAGITSEEKVSFSPGLLEGKKVLISGAGKNIGKSIAYEMAEQGAQIYFTDKHAKRCRRLEKDLLKKNVKTRGFITDCSDIDQLNILLGTLKKESIHIDVLVNNVGITPARKPFKETDTIEWQQVINTNVLGPCHLTKHIVRTMVEKKIYGSVIFITSIHQQTIFGSASYSSSKAALLMLIRELAMEFAKDKIRVNGIAPGWVAENEHQESLFHEYTPLHQCSINPCYIGRAAVYLASDYFSKFTTGSILTIDGGLSLHSYLTTIQA